jgi:pantoate--beta-alanine ligase
MVRDLNFPVRIVVCPISREPDGLAMSSRNRYLSPDERKRALILSSALSAAEQLARKGETSAERLRTAMLDVFATDPVTRVDYAEVVDPDTLLPVPAATKGTLIAVAARVGTTRLIDNLLLSS